VARDRNRPRPLDATPSGRFTTLTGRPLPQTGYAGAPRSLASCHPGGERAASSFWLPCRAPALLLGAALVVGGLGGVVLGSIALPLVLDRVFVLTGWTLADADHVFARLVRRRRWEALVARLRRRPPAERRFSLLSEDSGWASLAERRRRGLEPILLDSIVGTVKPDKATAFDRGFRPPPWTRGRWKGLWLAARRGCPLPPISVYRVYIRDGHHRVSVALALGAVTIDAEVVELHPPPAGDAARGSRRGRRPARGPGRR
jgi:hypothetical protein